MNPKHLEELAIAISKIQDRDPSIVINGEFHNCDLAQFHNCDLEEFTSGTTTTSTRSLRELQLEFANAIIAMDVVNAESGAERISVEA